MKTLPRGRIQIFLSHSNGDRDLAAEIAYTIEYRLAFWELDVDVFNTSEPEDRFNDFDKIIQAGVFRKDDVEEYEAELMDYLRTNLVKSTVYLLLATRQSLKNSRRWMAFEIALAHEEAGRRNLVFIPCLAGGAHAAELPPKAAIFHALDLSSNIGYGQLIHQLRMRFTYKDT